jgi:hypothetical protein
MQAEQNTIQWIAASTPPTRMGPGYEVLMPNGDVCEAMWTGARFWHGEEIAVERWRDTLTEPLNVA